MNQPAGAGVFVSLFETFSPEWSQRVGVGVFVSLRGMFSPESPWSAGQPVAFSCTAPSR